MKLLFKFTVLVSCVAALIGCNAAMVPYSNDPKTKLAQATTLFEKLDRPLPAQRLILEAIETYQTRNDNFGLAAAYRKYGLFFRSDSAKKWWDDIRKLDSIAKMPGSDNRLDLSIEYLLKARDIFSKSNLYDSEISNININLAWSYEEKGELKLACEAYDDSLKYSKQYIKNNPDYRIRFPKEYKSYDEYIATEKKASKCP